MSRRGMGGNNLGSPHFGEGHRGYITLNIKKKKKNSSSIFFGQNFDPPIGRGNDIKA